MATSLKAFFFFASTLCLVSLALAASHSSETFKVVGRVYCDNCRAQFVTKISKYISGAKVRLECRDREGGHLTYKSEGETDSTGTYELKVEGDHEEEVCEVALVKSSDPDCAEIDHENFLGKSARISLTKDSGISSDIRLANPLGFMVKERLPECTEVLRELGITPSGLV
ncbi:Pollen Ole e 1 allergen/extensin [Corchorus capsularis]|uniref:Pollen Ole e 1 allergen/extensin n=1 Tax=Corchorus capsularis TaxID=210143 RepID=A0A1R3JDV7_COCAP|nr:Pollen Ole e 1 allergen/extensin [Corchorus capsularis]